MNARAALPRPTLPKRPVSSERAPLAAAGITDPTTEIPQLLAAARLSFQHRVAQRDLRLAEVNWRNFSARNSPDDAAHEDHRITVNALKVTATSLGNDLASVLDALHLSLDLNKPVRAL